MAKETRKVHISVTSNASKDLNKGTVAAKGLSGSLKGVGASAQIATGGIRAMTMALISSGVGVFVVALGAAVGAIGGIINKSREFASSMSNLKAIIGADKDETIFAELADDAKRLGASTAYTASQVVSLQTEYAKLGFSTDEILGATEATLNLAAATKSDLATAAAIAGATMRGFGMDANEMARITDVMALSFSSSTLDMNKFSEAMKYVAPVSKIMKVSVEESTAALGILADNSIHGSMAGTNLRKVMAELTKTTGKGFRESLEIVSEKLNAASSDSEKLAIAQKLVGNRAYGALQILADNRAELDNLTESLENSSEGYAKLAAEAQLDNLNGDITKLGSAWEGFILSMEDGDGILSKIARGSIQALTFLTTALTEGFAELSFQWNFVVNRFEYGIGWMSQLGNEFTKLGIYIDEFAIDAMLALADVPFIGSNFDKNALANDKKQLEARWNQYNKIAKEKTDELNKLDEEADKLKLNHLLGKTKRAKEAEARVMKSVMGEFREGEESADEKQRQKDLEAKKEFLKKLKKLQEDTDDETELEKIERKRERHLAELKTIKMNAEERGKAELAIAAIYDELRDRQIEKNDEEKAKKLKDFMGQFGSDDAEQKLADRKAAHLAELELLKLEETEKKEAIKAVNDYYDSEQSKIDEDKRLQKQQQDRLEYETKRGLILDGLDLAIQASGEESKIGQALLKVKQGLMLAEMVMKINAYIQHMKLVAQEGINSTAVKAAEQSGSISVGFANAAKLGPPFNAIPLALMGIQAAMMLKNMAKSKKEMKKATAGLGGTSRGGGGGSAPQAPNFNVIGNTSNDANLIADTVAGVNDRPIRAYVVDKDVTSTQELTRNTETAASVG